MSIFMEYGPYLGMLHLFQSNIQQHIWIFKVQLLFLFFLFPPFFCFFLISFSYLDTTLWGRCSTLYIDIFKITSGIATIWWRVTLLISSDLFVSTNRWRNHNWYLETAVWGIRYTFLTSKLEFHVQHKYGRILNE